MSPRSKKVSKSRKNGKHDGVPDGLWIAPRYSLKGPAGERAWENRPGGVPSSSKYLELADIALGLKKPEPTFKKRKATGAHELRHLKLGIPTLRFWRDSSVPWVSKLAFRDHAIPGIVPLSCIFLRGFPSNPALSASVAHFDALTGRYVAHLSIT
jgi:hypothetical protein